MSSQKDYVLTFVELRSVREIRSSPIYHLSHPRITNKRPAAASDKQLPQSSRLKRMLCTGCTVHTVTYPQTHMGRTVPPQEYKAERVEGKACVLREIQPS